MSGPPVQPTVVMSRKRCSAIWQRDAKEASVDATRFDAAAKSLAHGMSRRRVLRGLLAGVAATVTSRALPAAATCTPPGFPNYCNADSECCDNGLCINGICQCPAGKKKCGDGCIDQSRTCGPQYCPTGYRQCGSQCIDTTRDHDNCGSCGHVCGIGATCSNSHCCAKGYVYCNGACRLSSNCTLLS